MNVIILSDYDRIALDLHKNLRLHGLNSALLTNGEVLEEPGVYNVSIFKSRRIVTMLDHTRAFVYRKLLLRAKGHYFQDIDENHSFYRFSRIRRCIPFKPEAVLILFDYRMVTARTLADLHRWSKAKIIWLMVDMKPLTGGCAYSGPCTKYTIDCRDCPLIGNPIFHNYARYTLETRERLLKDVDLHLVAASTYLYKQARASRLFGGRPIHKMFLPSNARIFESNGRGLARKALQLPAKTKIILIGAQNFKVERKGYRFLVDALRLLKTLQKGWNMIILSVGNGELPADLKRDYRVVSLGWVNFETLSTAYQAADVFLCPSIEDSGPIMVNQSIMCGTPVVAFKMGVSIDLVKDGKTGYLSEIADAHGLAEGLRKILSLSPEERLVFAGACAHAAKQLDYRAFVKKLKTLLINKS